MRHRNYRAASFACRPLNRFLDEFLRFRIQRRRRFVEKEELGLAEQCSRERETLLLSAGQRHTLGAETRCVAVGQGSNEVVDLGVAACGFDGGVGGESRGDGERDVLADRAFVEGGLLANERELRAIWRRRKGGDGL